MSAAAGVAEEQLWCNEYQNYFSTNYLETYSTLPERGEAITCEEYADEVMAQCVIHYTEETPYIQEWCMNALNTYCNEFALFNLPSGCWEINMCWMEHERLYNYCYNMHMPVCITTVGPQAVASLCQEAWYSAFNECNGM